MSNGIAIRNRLLRRILASTTYPATLLVVMTIAWQMLYVHKVDLYWVAVPVGITMFFLLFMERLLPYRGPWNVPQEDLGTDAFYVVFNLGLREASGFLFKIGLVSGLVYVPQAYAIQTAWPGHWHPLLQVLLAVLVLDFFEYWFHRASHRLPFLWRFHAIHHSPRRLYVFNASRFHFVDWLVLNAIEVGILFLIGVDPRVIALGAVFVQIHGLFQHANIETRLGFLNYIFSAAELHRWHHSRIVSESDKNFGNNVILWDLLFGTFYLPRDREVGVLGLLNPTFPRHFLGQAMAPFRRQPLDKPVDYRQRKDAYLQQVADENERELMLYGKS